MNNNQQNDVLNNQNDPHQFDDAFMKTLSNNNANNTNQNKFINTPINTNQNVENEPSNNDLNEVNNLIKTPQNRFINNDVDMTNTHSLNDLNIESDHQDGPKVDYSKDPKVIENMKKKNTINIGSEGKIFLIIIIVLFIFVLVLPTVFDLIRKIQYQ